MNAAYARPCKIHPIPTSSGIGSRADSSLPESTFLIQKPTDEEKTAMSESTEAALAKVEAGIEAVRDSERFRQYLAFCGKFHKYSFAIRCLSGCRDRMLSW